MQDFPIFTTQSGVTSLVLREIPYKGEAYITIRDASNPVELLKECVDFCKTVGAEHIYATGHPVLEEFPLHTTVLKMRIALESLPESDAALFPVTEQTLEQWREIYCEKMKSVPNAATMTKEEARKMLQRGDGYFVHRNGMLLGIGMVSGNTIHAIASVIPGEGAEVLCTLCYGLVQEYAELEVAAENRKAVRLYERLGFVRVAEVSRWYNILEKRK